MVINEYLSGAKVNFPTPFFLGGKAPLDIRSVVSTKDKLKLSNFKDGEDDFWYLGMIVGCQEDGKLYILKSESEGFVEVGKETSVPIKSVSVNGKIITPEDGNVDIKLSKYSVYQYKGSLSWTEIEDLTQKETGDVYNSTTPVTKGDTIYPTGTNVAWNGTDWDALGGIYEQFISSVDTTYFKVDNKQLTISETCPLINKIEVIKLNGQAIEITEKSVNIVLPDSAIYWIDVE